MPQRGSSGAAAVEFAIVAVVLLTLVFGVIDFGRMLWVDLAVKSASREGARMMATGSSAAVAKSAVLTSSITSMAMTPPSATNPSFTSVSTLTGQASGTECTSLLSGGKITVTIQVSFKFLTPLGTFIGFGLTSPTTTLTGSTAMRCE